MSFPAATGYHQGMPDDVNPFATRFTRPGAIPYRFPAGKGSDYLLAKLSDLHGWGQIIGPHGSGKSTLLQTLAADLEARGRRIVRFTQGAGERRLKTSDADVASWDANTQVIVDGFEQLGWLARRWVKQTCRLHKAGLLVTAHEDMGFPLLWATAPDEALAQQLVADLLDDQQRRYVNAADVSLCYQQHAGNLRETLFALYDLYERRRHAQS